MLRSRRRTSHAGVALVIRGRAAERQNDGESGAALEAAVKKGGSRYELLGKAHIKKQHTPMAWDGTFTGTAPLDFEGWALDEKGIKQPVLIECKSTAKTALDFAAKNGVEQHQLYEIQKHVALTEQVWLVVEMSALGEVYRVDGRDIVAFADAPWRSSLSIHWLRAHGEICRQTDRGNPKQHAVWWLDARFHPERDIAGLAVAEEKARCEGRVVELYPRSNKPSTRGLAAEFREMFASKPGPDATDAEYLAYVKRMSGCMLERDYRAAKKQAGKPKTFGRRGRG